jgi:diaminopimelate dehydrogenase
MSRQRVAIVGLGRLGRCCAAAVGGTGELELAGVVRRAESASKLAPPLDRVAVVTHLRDLGRVDAALLCVPPGVAADVARQVLQLRVPVVECAMLEGAALAAHYAAIGNAARNHRVAAVVGAGWNPGMLPLLRKAFEILIPDGRTYATARPGANLHHTEAARNVPGVRDALAAEYPVPGGRPRRYVYVELSAGVDAERVRAAFAGDPLFGGEETLVFPVESVAALEGAGEGVLLERRGTARSGAHQNLLLEARFDLATFAARAMVDAVRRLPMLRPGAHPYAIWGRSLDAEEFRAR